MEKKFDIAKIILAVLLVIRFIGQILPAVSLPIGSAYVYYLFSIIYLAALMGITTRRQAEEVMVNSDGSRTCNDVSHGPLSKTPRENIFIFPSCFIGWIV